MTGKRLKNSVSGAIRDMGTEFDPLKHCQVNDINRVTWWDYEIEKS